MQPELTLLKPLHLKLHLRVSYDIVEGPKWPFVRGMYALACEEDTSLACTDLTYQEVCQDNQAIFLDACEYHRRVRDYINTHLIEHLEYAIQQLRLEAEAAVNREIRPGLIPFEASETVKILRQKNEEAESRQKDRLGIGELRGGREPKKLLIGLSERYEQLLPQWQQAKRHYKGTRMQSDWIEQISKIFPTLPRDLIKRLDETAPPPPKYTDVDKYERNTSHQPANIALQHAARLCGAQDTTYSVSRLREIRRAQEKAKKTADQNNF